ncbi:hypothetical protein [Erwinia sp. S38]|uniref:hypothetical protein n=1 Tax=Erwinia sp. S38 TaxID=2769338 RepID=UPI00190A8DCA|nr:hypothetical protein [Erwinia sp. S38]MBK0003151.1 hypothetical protein [Erwinia sp. S38]
MRKKLFIATLILLNICTSTASVKLGILEKMQAVFECAGLAGEGFDFDKNGEDVRESLSSALNIYKKTMPEEVLYSYKLSPDTLTTDFALAYQQIGVANANALISESLNTKGITDNGENRISEARHLWDARRCNLIIRR